MDLHLSNDERAYLAGLGVDAGPDGSLVTTSGRPVSDAAVLTLLAKASPVAGREGVVGAAGSPGSPGDVAKAMLPGYFMRGYLGAGHAAESPANTGRRGTTAVPDAPQIEGRDFTRGYLGAGHAAASPDDMPADNPHYAAAAAVYEANQRAVMAEHVVPSTAITAQHAAPVRAVSMPQDMNAANVPMSISVQASKPAPGEQR